MKKLFFGMYLMFFGLLFQVYGQDIVGGVVSSDHNALVALYNATDGSNWNNNENWNTDADVLEWHGVVVDNQRVTEIDLIGNGLEGSIPAEIGNLTAIIVLKLRDNELNGNIPSEINQLAQLSTLYLDRNNITGFGGPIPDLSTSLQISLSRNYLSFADVEQANFLGYMSFLPQKKTDLQVSEEDGTFVFEVPEHIETNVYTWYKNGEVIDGETDNVITVDPEQAPGMYKCSISNTNYSSSTYMPIWSCVAGAGVEVSNDVLKQDFDALLAFYNATQGSNWYSNSNWNTNEDVEYWEGVTVENNRVVELTLGANNLIGNLPAEIGNLEMLTSLRLPANKLIGNVPEEIGNLENLTFLDLGINQFSGHLPEQINNLEQLSALEIEDNYFSGIDFDFQNLVNLGFTRLNNNYFSFYDLANANVPVGDYYYPQKKVQVSRSLNGSLFDLEVPEHIVGNQYIWIRDLNDTLFSETNYQLSIDSIANPGMYTCIITNPAFPNLVLTTLTEAIGLEVSNGILKSEYDNLISIFNATHGQNWVNNLNWNTNENVEYWEGITLTNRRVTAIELSNNQLMGEVPAELGSFEYLNELNISSNFLYGNIPSSICTHSNLQQLYFHNNRISGFETDIVETISIRGAGNNCLSFYDIEMYNGGFINFLWQPQANIVPIRDDVTITIPEHISGNVYQWYKDNVIIDGAEGDSYAATESGSYHCVITNSQYDPMTLQTIPELISMETTNQFTLTIISNGTGNVSVNGETYTEAFSFNSEENLTLEALGVDNFGFAYWFVDGSLSFNNQLSLALNKSVVVEVFFIKNRVLFGHASYEPFGLGTIAVESNNSPITNGEFLPYGTILNIILQPDYNCSVVSLTINGTDIYIPGQIQYEYELMKDIDIRVEFQNNVVIDTEPLQERLVVYPNPTVDVVYFKGVEMPADVSVFSITGQCKMHQVLTNNQIEIGHLPFGTYFIRINNEVVRIIKK